MLVRIFPFIIWFKGYSLPSLRSDFVAGLTVALVLIPQSMAYAQLAGLPAYYGLYAAFLPPMVAALFGSSRQLATGPVAVVSLMTAAALEPLATAGSDTYIAYAVLMALVVGGLQLALGLLRLGMVVNFLSHPVVNGFTNAAALIIASSQLSKLFGVYVDGAEHHYETVWRVVVAAWHFTHWPTLGMAVLAFAIMYGIKRVNPRIPFVLVAVAVTSLIAWATGFQHDRRVPLQAIRDPWAAQLIRRFNEVVTSIDDHGKRRADLGRLIYEARERSGPHSTAVLDLLHQQDVLKLRLVRLKEQTRTIRETLRAMHLVGVTQGESLTFFRAGREAAAQQGDGRRFRIKVGNTPLDEGALVLMGGGAVVGRVPPGLPTLALPELDLKMILQFLPIAAIISLLGFMEAISIAKAMATRTRQRLDPNQELIGQGLANILGSLGQSYPVSGSFSRSAVNIGAGAVSGLSSVFTSLLVVLTLLLFTPLLFYIPQSVLAAVIMMAVLGLINVKGFVHAYRAQRYDGVIAVISFLCTLGFAPHLDRGILVGVVLSIGHYLYRNSRPRVASLSLHPDYSLRDADHHGLNECEHIAVVRFEGPLFFANTAYLEDKITERVQARPRLRHVLLVANGINEIDASGEEALSLIVETLRLRGIEVSFSGLNEQVRDLFRRTHLLEKVGEEHIFPTQAQALRTIHAPAHEHSFETECPLIRVCFAARREPEPGEYRVLVVDDEEEFTGYLAKRLQRRGMQVTVCNDPTQAMARMTEAYHEVVLMDIRMPQLSGVDLLKEMRSDWPNVQVIMLTGQGTSLQAFELGKLGAFDYLTKPCDLDRLVGIIKNAVVAAQRRSASATTAQQEV